MNAAVIDALAAFCESPGGGGLGPFQATAPPQPILSPFLPAYPKPGME